MSQLLFTCSSQREYNKFGSLEGDLGSDGTTIGIENPNSYINNLTNTITIPARSEVAIVQCEINRDDGICIDPFDRFYLYLGEKLSSLAIKDVGAIPYPVQMDPEGITECYALQDYALQLKNILDDNIYHPDYYRNSKVSLDATGTKLKIEIKSHGNMKASSMNMGITSYTVGSEVLAWFMPHFPTIGDDNFTMASDGNALKRTIATDAVDPPSEFWDNDCILVNRQAPLSQVEGTMIMDFSKAEVGSKVFIAGLTRPQTKDMLKGVGFGGLMPITYNPTQGIGVWSNDEYCDFFMKFAYKTGDASGKRYVSMWQMVNESYMGDGGDKHNSVVRLKEVEYWDAGGAGGRPTAQWNEDDIFTAGKKWSCLVWRITGNQLDCWLANTTVNDGSANAWDYPGNNSPLSLASEATGRTVGNSFAPLTQNHWTLYPLLDLAEKDQEITYTHYGGMTYGGSANWENDKFSYNYPMDDDDTQNGTNDVLAGSSWWGYCYASAYDTDSQVNGEAIKDLGVQCERFPWRSPKSSDNTNAKQRYFGIDGATGVGEACNEVSGIITKYGSSDDFDYDNVDIYATYQGLPPNAGAKLGSPYRNLIQTIDGTTAKLDGTVGATYRALWSLGANDLIAIENNGELLMINCPTFTHQTYNMCRNVPSKYLYVVPRFDAQGNEKGRMFWDVPDRTYVTMNNPDPITINDIHTTFTDRNGIISTDLIGSSMVVYHIRGEETGGLETGGG
tara:strand:- start:1046 stop:3241 length:2196 start_codon:yes stop_codon:yes gene_type:complete